MSTRSETVIGTMRALRIAGLFKLAAERAEPGLVEKVIDLDFRK